MADVVVVGAGIVGASVAYHAARAGAVVKLIDKSLPASGVTADSFGWIGGPAEADVPDASAALRRSVVADYRRLQEELRGLQVRWTGSLRWGGSASGDDIELASDERLVDGAQVRQLEPALRVPPARALHKTSDGAVDAVAVTEALVTGARDHGAELMVGVAVIGLRRHSDRVVGVATSAGFVRGHTVVLAAGVDTALLCAPLRFDLPVAPSPALLLRVSAPVGVVRTLVASPELEVREPSSGQLVIAASYSGEDKQEELARTAEEMVRRLTATFAVDARDVRLISVRVGMRPMPADGLPIIGPLHTADGVYLAVMHPGVTLAPAAGRLIAAEVVDHIHAPELRDLRPERLTADGSSSGPLSRASARG